MAVCITEYDAQMVFSKFYKILLKLKYPEIVKAEEDTVQFTIFEGENRVNLLHWLIARSLPNASELENLNGPALTDEIVKLYDEIGICSDRNILLGNCKLEEQLPTLRLLLDFVITIYIEVVQSNQSKLKNTKLEPVQTSPSNSFVKSSDVDAKKYFEGIEKYVDNIKEIELEEVSDLPEEVMNFNENEEINSQLTIQVEKFIEAFAGQIPEISIDSTKPKLDKEINSIYADFTAIKQIIQIGNNISKLTIPSSLRRTFTPLTSTVEETVINMEETLKLDVENKY
ncbi:uncharacterized protein [Prorops nasuta]|uniref:uncharacterized protein n=1 Tax=Prorops nasuta TaxID=863751 RepID=UPI0034CF3644